MSTSTSWLETTERRFHPVRFTFGLVALALAVALAVFLRSSDALTPSAQTEGAELLARYGVDDATIASIVFEESVQGTVSLFLIGFFVAIVAFLLATASFLLATSWRTIDWVEGEQDRDWVDRYWSFEFALAASLAVIVGATVLLLVPLLVAVGTIVWIVAMVALLTNWMNAGDSDTQNARDQLETVKTGLLAVAAGVTTVALVWLLIAEVL